MRQSWLGVRLPFVLMRNRLRLGSQSLCHSRGVGDSPSQILQEHSLLVDSERILYSKNLSISFTSSMIVLLLTL
jgi:hypothetical protein